MEVSTAIIVCAVAGAFIGIVFALNRQAAKRLKEEEQKRKARRPEDKD